MSRDVQSPTNVRWMVFGLGFGTSWLLYLHRYTFALIKPKLTEEWGLSNTELGVLDGGFAIFYAACQFPAGVAVDLLGAHLFLGGIILFWSLMLLLHTVVPGAATMWYVRAGFGAGQAGAFASISRVSKTWFPLATRSTAQGWMGVFAGRIGGASANILYGTVLIGLISLSWRMALTALAICGIIHGVAFLLLFRNSARDHPWANDAEADLIEEVHTQDESQQSADVTTCPMCGAAIGPSDEDCPKCGERFDEAGETEPKPGIRELLKRMSPRSILNLFSITLTSTLSTVVDSIYSLWIPQFLYQVHGLNFKQMGIYSALPLLGGACGGAFGGMLNDRLIARFPNRRWVRSLVGLSGKGTAGVLLIVALLTAYDDPHRFCILLFLVKFFADISLATRWGAVTDISGNATGTVFALNNSLAAGIGGVAAPLLFGFVADQWNWYTVFTIGGVMYLACAASWLLINCTIPLVGDGDEQIASNQ